MSRRKKIKAAKLKKHTALPERPTVPQEKALSNYSIKYRERFKPLLPGSWKINALIFLLLIFATLLLYAGDLRLGFFSVDDPGYVTDNPWIKKITPANLIHILTVPYFSNYSPMHLLSYMADYVVDGPNAFIFHLSSNIWAGIATGLVYLVALAFLRNRAIAIAASVLFVVHPVHVEAIVWISSRKDVIAVVFALPSLLAYLQYRKGGIPAKHWYILSLFLFLLATAGKLSTASFPAVLLALDLFLEKRPLVRSLVDKIPFLFIGILFAWLVAGAQPESGNPPDPYVYFASLAESLWLLTGAGSYTIYRVPPKPAGMGLEILASIILLAAFVLPLLLRRRLPLVAVFIYWILFTYLPSQILSFVHPVTDRYLFFPSVAVVILIAWGIINAGKKFGRTGLGVSYVILSGVAFLWCLSTIKYLREWQDSRSVWFGALKKSTDPDVYYSLGAHYVNISAQLGAAPRGKPLSEKKKKDLASKVWGDDPRLPNLISEWGTGQQGGAFEKEFQTHLWSLAEESFNKTLEKKGSRVMPHLYFRMGVLLLDRGDLQEAKNKFLDAIDEVSRYTVTDVGHELTVVSYANLGYIAQKEGNFHEALEWYKLGYEKQTQVGGNWVPDIATQRKKMEASVAMLSGKPGSDGNINDPNIAYNIGMHYLNNSNRLGDATGAARLPIEDAKRLANEVWKDNPQLSALFTEWTAGQHGGPVERSFQAYLKELAWDAFEKAVQIKGTTVHSNLFFRRGMLSGDRGDMIGARKEFLTALQEASLEQNEKVKQEIIVLSHDALGILSWREKKYKEALQWFQKALQEQNGFEGNWVPDLKNKCEQMEARIASSI